MFDCSIDCFEPYQDFAFIVTSCDTVTSALDCYYANQFACDADFNLFFTILRAMNEFGSLGCGDGGVENTTPEEHSATNTESTVTLPVSTTPEFPAEPSCPSVFHEDISGVPNMSSAVIPMIPESHRSPQSCTAPHPRVTSLRQCSLFMESQLRAFDGYRGGLEACSIPGSWYLFHHPRLTVEVEGENFETGSNHTRLTRVNVTFHAHECNPTARTYTVSNSEVFPSNFMPSQPDNSDSPLQILFGEDRSVVTLLDTWLNATIVIRKYMEFLSVTLQVPSEVSLASEGLCTGCPSHMYINISTLINNLYPSLCPEVNTRVLNDCFDHGGVANIDELLHIMNNSYLDACVHSLFKIGRTLDVLTMFNAISNDAQLLVNGGVDPRTLPTIPVSTESISPLSLADTTTQTKTTTQSTPITNSPSTMEVSASTSYHNSRLPQMLVLTLLALHYILLLQR